MTDPRFPIPRNGIGSLPVPVRDTRTGKILINGILLTSAGETCLQIQCQRSQIIMLGVDRDAMGTPPLELSEEIVQQCIPDT